MYLQFFDQTGMTETGRDTEKGEGFLAFAKLIALVNKKSFCQALFKVGKRHREYENDVVLTQKIYVFV